VLLVFKKNRVKETENNGTKIYCKNETFAKVAEGFIRVQEGRGNAEATIRHYSQSIKN